MRVQQDIFATQCVSYVIIRGLIFMPVGMDLHIF